jgi:hypothetical protein
VRDDLHKELYYAAEEYRVYILDALRKSGFVVVGAENILFGQDKGAEARFVLGGTIISVRRGVVPESPALAEMAVVWELFDIQQQIVIYKIETRDAGTLRSKKDSVGLLMRCLGSLMRRQAFRNALLPSEGKRPSASNDAPATFQSCPTCECGGRMKIVAAVTDPASVRHYLKGVGLPADPPLIAPARASPQLDFDW